MKGDITEYLGVATTAVNKKNKVRKIEVYCPTLMPFPTGQHGNDVEPTIKVDIKDINKGQQSAEVKTSDTITCDYLGSEAYTDVPDVHIGERVKIICFSNTTKFYWVPIGIDEKIRHTEHKRISVANKRNTNKELDDDNCYYIELDTKYAKHIHIHTGQSDGEPFSYDIKIDSEKNTVKINDNSGNHILLDSNIPRIHLKNRMAASVDLIATDINITAPNNINITAGNMLTVTAAKAMTITSPTCKESYVTHAVSSAGSSNFSGGSINVKYDKYDLFANKLDLFGKNITVGGLSGTGGHCPSHGAQIIYP